MRLRFALFLAAVAAAASFSACGNGSSCCRRSVTIPADTTWGASIGGVDGGTPTDATLTVWADGGATLVFTSGTHRVEVQAAVQRSW